MLPGVAVLLNGSKDDGLTAALRIEVKQQMGRRTEYALSYAFDESGGDYALASDARVGPGSEIAVVAPFGGVNEYLVKGPVIGQILDFKRAGEGSEMLVRGCDTTVLMDRESKARIWEGLDSDTASAILSEYGYTPDVTATQAGHFEPKNVLVQRDTDYTFLQMLAARNGYLLWISCDAEGMETAHVRRPALDALPVKDLVLNGEQKQQNVESIHIEWESERVTSVVAKQLDLTDHSVITGDVRQSPLTPLGDLALSAIAAGIRSQHLQAPVDDAADLQARAESALIDEGWFVSASCQTTATLLGGVVKPTEIVNVRGLGTRHSGKWLVAGVHHVITQEGHMMHIDLCRNAWGGA